MTIVYLAFLFTFNVLFKIKIVPKINNELLIKYLVANTTNNNTFNSLYNFNVTSPNNLFKFGLNNMFKGIKADSYVFSSSDEDEPGSTTEYIADPNPVNIDKPLIYIYNTHQLENYSAEKLAPYNIKPNVLMASYILRENLNDLGIPTIVETRNITEILRINGWAYKYSYEASKMMIIDTLEKNSSIEYIIDLHRDSSKYEKTTTEINKVKYAKILFVVGKEHENYAKNLAIANKLNDLLISEDKSLSRGIMLKEGPGVNGIYNQNLNENAILIEMGGQYNTIEEVNNTIPILSKILFKLMGDMI